MTLPQALAIREALKDARRDRKQDDAYREAWRVILAESDKAIAEFGQG